jgi:hypothetical protein
MSELGDFRIIRASDHQDLVDNPLQVEECVLKHSTLYSITANAAGQQLAPPLTSNGLKPKPFPSGKDKGA